MEHTHADAPIHARIVEYMRVAIVQDLSRPPPPGEWEKALNDSRKLEIPQPYCLNWGLTGHNFKHIQESVSIASKFAKANIAAHRLDLVSATHISSGRIKACKMSPDSFVQVALQLAFYRDQDGRNCSTYETGTTRAFLHGRTATIRSSTIESLEFSRAVLDRASTVKQFRLMQAALAAHGTILRESVQAKGIDRHLLGIRLLALGMQQAGCDPSSLAPARDFFEDEAFAKSSTWELSTSNMSWIRTYDYPGFGAPTKQGYGCCYNITNAALLMTVSANAESGKDPSRFSKNILWACDTMLALAETALDHAKL